MSRIKFSGHSKGEYTGAIMPWCAPESSEAVSWMACINTESRSFNSVKELLARIQKLLDWSYDQGCIDTQERIQGNILKVLMAKKTKK